MFCCLFRKREQTKDLSDEFNIEQVNVLVSLDRESERTRNSSVYHTSSVYLKDTSIYTQFSDIDEYIVYEVLHTIIDNIINKSGTN